MKSFFTSQDKTITDKAFSQSLVISVISILLCLVALCSVTYAWFTEETSSSGNTLISGSFGLEQPVVTRISDGDVSTVDSTADIAVSVENGDYFCTLPARGTYLVTLTCGESTAKGHCVITINDCQKSTDVILGESTVNKEGYSYAEGDRFTFRIQTSEEDVVVKFHAAWGVVVSPEIEKNDTYSTNEWVEPGDPSTTEDSTAAEPTP